MSGEIILFIEDDEQVLNSLSLALKKTEYAVSQALDAEAALKILEKITPDLILLDLNLPGMNGSEFAKICRADNRFKEIPIVVITGVDFEDAIVDALEQYADDYINKPVRPRVLLARLQAVLRRAGKEQKEIMSEKLMVNLKNHEVTLDGTIINLTRSEFNILKFLYQNPNQPFSRDEIIKEIRGDDYHVVSRSLDYQIFCLRKKLGESSHLIETMRGVGFRYKAMD